MSDQPAPSTREQCVREISERLHDRDVQLSVWRSTGLIGRIPDAEWTAMHAGTCLYCPSTSARLYPVGWRCGVHAP